MTSIQGTTIIIIITHLNPNGNKKDQGHIAQDTTSSSTRDIAISSLDHTRKNAVAIDLNSG